jgi:hypothetical protein
LPDNRNLATALGDRPHNGFAAGSFLSDACRPAKPKTASASPDTAARHQVVRHPEGVLRKPANSHGPPDPPTRTATVGNNLATSPTGIGGDLHTGPTVVSACLTKVNFSAGLHDNPPDRFGIADDHEVVRAGPATMPEGHPGFTVVGTPRADTEPERLDQQTSPHVVRLGPANGHALPHNGSAARLVMLEGET